MRVNMALALVLPLALLLSSGAGALPASYEPPEDNPTAERVLPAGDDDYSVIEIATDGTILVGETAGPVWRLGPNETEPQVVWDPPVTRGPEMGLVGLALAPDFDETGDFFAVYMTDPVGAGDDADLVTRLVRVHDGEETVIYEYPATRFHNSGRILIHDGYLFLSRGEQNVREQSQDPENEAGKILRMTLDGQPAPDNPLGGYVYAMGFRNPFGLVWDEERDWLVEAEVGNSENDEVNVVLPGRNYAWPRCEGPCETPDDDFEDPIVHYPQVATPTGIVVVGTDYYHGSFNLQTLHRVRETPEGWTSEIVYQHPARYPIIDVERTPDGRWLYFGTADGLWRIPTPQDSVDSMADVAGPEDRLGEPTTGVPPGEEPGDGTPPTDGGQGGDGGDGADAGTDENESVTPPPVDGPADASGANPTPLPGVPALLAALGVAAALAAASSGRPRGGGGRGKGR